MRLKRKIEGSYSRVFTVSLPKLLGLIKDMSLNIDSVLGHIDQLRILLDQEKPHIMCLNETKFNLSRSDSLVNVDNYQIVRNDRDRHGSGVAVYVHESRSYKIRSDLMPDNLEVVTLQIANSKFQPFIVRSLYRPTGKLVSYFNDMEALLASLDSDNKEAITMGDTTVIFWIHQTMTPTVAQIQNMIKRLINNKATGMNGIPYKILKDNSTYLSPFFEELFNLSIKTNTFPDDFKIGKVAPVFKTGDKEDLNNYRPISMLPTIARIFERLLYSQLCDYLTANKLLGDEQYEFRSLHSTAMALGKMPNQWLMNMGNGNLSAVVFLGIRKAFDTVDHTILLQKLNCYGIQGDSVKLLESYLTDRMQCCSVNSHTSPLEIIKCGVPQGSIFGPLLFIVYMNDLPKGVNNVDITMSADDTNFMWTIPSLNEIKDELIPALRKVYNWLTCDKLSLNTVKTEFMIIGTANGLEKLDKCPVSTPYLISSGPDCHIRRVRCVKYLGIIVDDTLT